MQPFIFGTDLHGIEQDRKAVTAFFKFVDDFDPQRKALRVFGGDLWNFAALRRAADEHEKTVKLNKDFLCGIEFLERFRPSVFILGNHDERLWDGVKRERINRTGWRAELCESYVKQFEAFAEKLNIRVFHYDKRKGVYRKNGMGFAHGFGCGDNLGRNMAKTYGDIMHGHGHKIERVVAMHTGRAVTAYQVGCLCRNDMDYARAELSALRQENGWGYGVLGRVNEVFQARCVNGQALVAAGFKTV